MLYFETGPIQHYNPIDQRHASRPTTPDHQLEWSDTVKLSSERLKFLPPRRSNKHDQPLHSKHCLLPTRGPPKATWTSFFIIGRRSYHGTLHPSQPSVKFPVGFRPSLALAPPRFRGTTSPGADAPCPSQPFPVLNGTLPSIQRIFDL